MQIFLIVLFSLLAIFHLYTCYFSIEALRKLTKPLLMLMLALIYTLYARQFYWAVLAAMLLGLVGDIFLIFPKNEKPFMAGACMFALGHVCYIISLNHFTDMIHTGGWARALWLLILVYIFALVLVMRALSSHLSADKKILMPIYIGPICIFGAGALSALILFGGLPLALLWLASVLFMTSDCILSFQIFKEVTPRGNFYVMLTYIAAQFLLALGFALI